MIQPLHEIRQATFIASPQTITFTFPAVPQGLRWTGTIAISSQFGGDPQLIEWIVYRNNVPILSGFEFPVFELQAVGLETIKLQGTYNGTAATIPEFQFTATWEGYSGTLAEIPLITPSVSNSTRGRVHVYNTLGPDGVLAVQEQPLGDVDASAELTSPNTSLNIMPVATVGYQIWELSLQITAASLAAETGAKWLTGTITRTDTGAVLLQGQVSTVPGSADSCPLRLSLHGLALPAGATLKVLAGAYTGANANVCASAVYTGS